MCHGVVVAVNVLEFGSGYTNTPIIVIEPPFIPQPTMSIVSLPVIGGSTGQVCKWAWGAFRPR